MVALLAAAFLVAKLVSVVKTGPPECAQSRWQKKCSEWQARMKKIVPLTAVKIVVVVWQIVTQVGALRTEGCVPATYLRKIWC